MLRALLVIDMQRVMRPVLWLGAELVERIAQLVAAAHRARIPVIAIQQTGPPGSPFDPADPGWQPDPRLRLEDTDLRIRKSATDTFFGTELGDLLSERGITTVVVVGAATEPRRPKATPTPTLRLNRSSPTTTGCSARRSIQAVECV